MFNPLMHTGYHMSVNRSRKRFTGHDAGHIYPLNAANIQSEDQRSGKYAQQRSC